MVFSPLVIVGIHGLDFQLSQVKIAASRIPYSNNPDLASSNKLFLHMRT